MMLFANDGEPKLLCAAQPHIFMNPITGTEGFVEAVVIDTRDGTKYRVVLDRGEIRRIIAVSIDLAPEGSVWKVFKEFHAKKDGRDKIRHAPSTL